MSVRVGLAGASTGVLQAIGGCLIRLGLDIVPLSATALAEEPAAVQGLAACLLESVDPATDLAFLQSMQLDVPVVLLVPTPAADATVSDLPVGAVVDWSIDLATLRDAITEVTEHGVRRPPPRYGLPSAATMEADTAVIEDDRAAVRRLTPRETDVLQALVAGADNSRIGESLGISLNTVRTHVAGILKKLKVSTRLEAAALAVRAGMTAHPALVGKRDSAGSPSEDVAR